MFSVHYRRNMAVAGLALATLALCLSGCSAPASHDAGTSTKASPSGAARFPVTFPASTASQPVSGGAELAAVSAQSPSTAWAVGLSCSAGCFTTGVSYSPLVMRGDSAGWTRTVSPSIAANAYLNDMAPGPGGTAWAVGSSCPPPCSGSSFSGHPLIAHWNGSSWAMVASPGPLGSALTGVTAGPGNTAWAVGSYCLSECGTATEATRTLILHWNGSAWARVASPSPDGRDLLYDVSAGPDGSAWAVGYSCQPAACTGQMLILRWNGAAWSRVAAPAFDGVAYLYGVSAGPDGTAWAVGYSCMSVCGTASAENRPLIVRWNGASWSQVSLPVRAGAGYLVSVTTGPDGTAWAVGSTCDHVCSQLSQMLIYRWDGRAWSAVPSPALPGAGYLGGVSAGPDGTAWAVGYSCPSVCGTSSKTDYPLILRWNGARWALVAATPS